MDPCFHVDATCEPPALATRILRLLANKVFHVQAAAFEGMEHLNSEQPPLTLATAASFAAALPLPHFDSSPTGLPKLHRLARICQVNPDVVNKLLPPKHRAPYF